MKCVHAKFVQPSIQLQFYLILNNINISGLKFLQLFCNKEGGGRKHSLTF